MPKISITNRDLPYGILDESIFWVENGILDKDSVRESRDEELVADLLLDLILDPMAVSGTVYRNSAYGRDSNATASASTVSARLATLGTEIIEKNFLQTLDLIKQTIETSGKTWASLVITQQNPRSIPRYFHAIFVALYELLFVENLSVKDLSLLTSEFSHFWDRDLTIPAGGGNWGANRKRPLFDSVKAVLRPHFEATDDPVAARARQTATEFEIELQMALTEQALFELKQGFTRLDASKSFDDEAFEAILRTASAMANMSPGARGFIIIGVADRPSDAARIEEIYGVQSMAVGEYSVTGTQHELSALGRTRDEHLRWLIDRIKSSRLEQPFASRLAESLTLFDYKGYLIWTLRPEAGANPTSWDGRFHTRQGNSTIELQGQQVVELMRRFPNS